MMKTYGILGTGTTSKGVIEDALNELGSDNEFVVGCEPKPAEGKSRVLDWLVGIEAPYRIVYKESAPEKYIEPANGEHPSGSSSIDEKVVSMLKKSKGTLLLLWDEEAVEKMERICFLAADNGVKILDLTNGLVPIQVEGDTPKEEEVSVPTEEIEVEPFSEDDLLSMPISVLRNTAKNLGIDTAKMPKEDIVKAILNNSDKKEEEEILPPIDLGTFKIVSTRATVSTNESETCMLTVVFPNGIIMSRPANVSEAKQLFGFEPTTW
jgi:hypothetical protein